MVTGLITYSAILAYNQANNPAGFTDPNIFALGMISMKVDIASINKNPIIIDEIHIGAPAVVYEINKSDVSNIDVLKKNLGVGGGGKSAGSSGGDQVKIIIRKLVVEGTSAWINISVNRPMRSRACSATDI